MGMSSPAPCWSPTIPARRRILANGMMTTHSTDQSLARKGKDLIMAGNALQKPLNLSAALEGVIGKGPLTRAQVTSKVWDYIKANGLQDKTDKRQINPDAKLGAVIGNAQISMFKMTAAVSKRSEEHTSELQSLMRISYAVFCLKKKYLHKNYK